MPIPYALSLILITIYLNPLLAMHKAPTITAPLTTEQNELISTVSLIREAPHRISFKKLKEYQHSTEKLFNKDTHPHHYHHLTDSLAKTEIDKSILIISTPIKKNLFNKKDCITEINWLALKITKLKEKKSPLLPYCIQQIVTCQPQCIQYLQSDKEFISQTFNNILILQNINPNFALTIPIDSVTMQKSNQLKNFLIKNFITVPDITLMQGSERNIINTLNECLEEINALYPYEIEEKKDLIAILRKACSNYEHIRRRMLHMKEIYAQSLLILEMLAPTTPAYAVALSTLVSAKNNNTLALFANLYREFTTIQQTNTRPLTFLPKKQPLCLT